MKISRWKKNASHEKTPGQMVRCSPQEALQIIASLARQLVEKNSNTGREEFDVACDGGQTEYFSIAVDFKANEDKPTTPTVSLRDAAVDLAGGTGDVARAFVKAANEAGKRRSLTKPTLAIVADINEAMLVAGRNPTVPESDRK